MQKGTGEGGEGGRRAASLWAGPTPPGVHAPEVRALGRLWHRWRRWPLPSGRLRDHRSCGLGYSRTSLCFRARTPLPVGHLLPHFILCRAVGITAWGGGTVLRQGLTAVSGLTCSSWGGGGVWGFAHEVLPVCLRLDVPRCVCPMLMGVWVVSGLGLLQTKLL